MARFLLVDDSPLARAMLRSAVTAAGHEVVGEAQSAEEAVKAFAALTPDVVTLDLIMPGSSGIEALKEIRRRDAKAVVIMVTATDQKGIKDQILELGAAAIVRKPFSDGEFQAALSQALAN